MSEEVQSKVQRIVDTETTVAAQESGVTLTVQPGVVEGLITRSLVSYATTILATDVEAFANHAGRDTVTCALPHPAPPPPPPRLPIAVSTRQISCSRSASGPVS